MTFEEYPLHDSIRGWFGRELYFEMQKNHDIILITADLGYGLFDRHRDDFPDRFYNVGASECLALGAAVGLSLSGKTCFVYSITSFLLFRGFEWIRNYIHHENIPVRLVGSGYEDDYKHDGVTHQPYRIFGMDGLLETQLWNIQDYFPTDKTDVPNMVKAMIKTPKPSFICLRR